MRKQLHLKLKMNQKEIQMKSKNQLRIQKIITNRLMVTLHFETFLLLLEIRRVHFQWRKEEVWLKMKTL